MIIFKKKIPGKKVVSAKRNTKFIQNTVNTKYFET